MIWAHSSFWLPSMPIASSESLAANIPGSSYPCFGRRLTCPRQGEASDSGTSATREGEA